MKKLPLVIDSELFIESIDYKPACAKSKILGARHGDFIIIENPIVHFSERLFGKLTGNIGCKFSQEGDVYEFTSSVRAYMDENFTLIDYPQTFQQKRLRLHPRIRVNIETRLLFDGDRDPLTVTMLDIGVGGCKLALPSLYGLAGDTTCRLSFSLPDNSKVENLRGKIRSVRMLKLAKRTEIGMTFLEPASELAKVASFCNFCLFFEV
jgi:hypothetical protein